MTAAHEEVQSAVEPLLDPVVSGPALDAAWRRGDATLRARLRDAHPLERPPPPPHTRHLKCDWLYCGGMLFPSGAVGPCCLSNNEPDDFGALTGGSTFADVWNNEKFRQARRMFVRDEPSSLVCSRCPNRNAQDYQFRRTMQAVLRNAPDWVLTILSRDPERFFFDVDFEIMAAELSPLRDGDLGVPAAFEKVADRLEAEASARATSRREIRLLQELLAAAPPTPAPSGRPPVRKGASEWLRRVFRREWPFRS